MSGEWIKHDGAQPQILPGKCEVKVSGEGIKPGEGSTIDLDYPGFFWRMQRVRVLWLFRALRPVCDDPAYAPIVAYRSTDESEAMALLRKIAANPAPMPDLVPA